MKHRDVVDRILEQKEDTELAMKWDGETLRG